MLTPSFTIGKTGETEPLYHQLYLYLKKEIEAGNLPAGEKLPSKRRLAAHLRISLSTIETAFGQLSAEGYIISRQRSGYYVSSFLTLTDNAHDDRITPQLKDKPADKERSQSSGQHVLFDLKTNSVDADHFPWSVWNRLMRQAIRRKGMLSEVHRQGSPILREQIARYLKAFRGISVSPDNILIGAGIEYLLGLLIDLLPGKSFALENPGYVKVRQLLRAKGVRTNGIPVDGEGIDTAALASSDARVAFVTPTNQFPMSIPMSAARRQKLLEWASQTDSWIIEDDFDSEFRFYLRPTPPLFGRDARNRVVYLNSFAKTLAPSLRIAYMVLPEPLMDIFREKLSFLSCTVSGFEQQTIASFMAEGIYERHISRMRTIYKNRRDAFVCGLQTAGEHLIVTGADSGLHLLIRSPGFTAGTMVQSALAAGVRVYPLSSFSTGSSNDFQTVVAGFAGCCEDDLKRAGSLLSQAWYAQNTKQTAVSE